MLYEIGQLDRWFMAGQPPAAVDVTSPEAAFEMTQGLPWMDDRESAWVLHLDNKHRLLGRELVSVGSVSQTFMAPREIFRLALLQGAVAVVVAHNHPSGDPEPSEDDRLLTSRLGRSGKLVGVEVLDHLIVGAPATDAWVSMARRGRL